METLLLVLIVLLSVTTCALAAYWLYRTAQERKQHAGSPQLAPQIARRPIRNDAWDRAVRAARNRNW
jgi:flagellar basal body-associated protein FliL